MKQKILNLSNYGNRDIFSEDMIQGPIPDCKRSEGLLYFIFLYIVFPLPNVLISIAIEALVLVGSNVLLCCARSFEAPN